MDCFKIITVSGKYKLLFEDHSYRYSHLNGNNGSRWTCNIKNCTAYVNINKQKDKITGGEYVHNHLADYGKQSTASPKEKDSTKNSPLSSRKSQSTTGTPAESNTPKLADIQVSLPPAAVHGGQDKTLDISTSLSPQSVRDTSILEQRNAAISTIMVKEQEREQLEAELAECRSLITSLQESLRTMEAAWEADRTELELLKKRSPSLVISSDKAKPSNSAKIKLTIVGDSHVHNLESVLSKIFSAKFNVKSYAKSGSSIQDVLSVSIREHNSEDYVIVFAGTNDVCKKSWATIEASLNQIIEKFCACKLIFIIVPPRRNAVVFNNHINALNVKICAFLDKKNVAYVNPSLVLRNNHYNRDGLHFNKEGKRSLCIMLREHIVEKKLFKLSNKPVGHNRSESGPRINKHNIPLSKINMHAKVSNRRASNYKSDTHSNPNNINIQAQRSSARPRYTHDSHDQYQNRRGPKVRHSKGKKTQYNTRVVRNSRFPDFYPFGSSCCTGTCHNQYYDSVPPYPHYGYSDGYGHNNGYGHSDGYGHNVGYGQYDYDYDYFLQDSDPYFLNTRR